MSLAACLMKARVEEALIKMHLPGVPICEGIELEDAGLCGRRGGAAGADAMVTRGNLSGMRAVIAADTYMDCENKKKVRFTHSDRMSGFLVLQPKSL